MPNTFPADGNVGIGMTGPQAHLDVSGPGDKLLLLTDTLNGSRLLIGTDDQLPGFLRLRPQAGDGVAITNDGDKIGLFVRATDGHVGVGTTTPRSELDVKGSISADFISASSVFVSFEGQLISVAQLLASLLGRVQSLELKVQSL